VALGAATRKESMPTRPTGCRNVAVPPANATRERGLLLLDYLKSMNALVDNGTTSI